MDTGQEVEVLQGDLFRLDAQLLVEFALSRPLDTHDGVWQVGASLSGHAKRMRAASVGPHVWESDLLGGTLLEKQLVLIVEKEDGEGSVEEPLLDVGHQMACKTTH